MYKRLMSLVLVAMLSVGVGYAAGSGKSITVYYDTIKKIMIDGADKTPTDVKPFIHEGTTYVPLRYIAEQLGKPVYFDAATQVIYIGSRPNVVSVEKKDLFSLPFSGMYNVYVYRFNNSTFPGDNLDNDAQFDYPKDYKMTFRTNEDNNNKTYEELTKGMSINVSSGETALHNRLNQEYTNVTGRVGYDGKLNRIFYPTTVQVIVDEVVRQEIQLDEKNRYADINASVIGGSNLKINMKVKEFNSSKSVYLNLTEMTLEKFTAK